MNLAIVVGSSVRAVGRALTIARLALAEIFEEAAYTRYLARHGMESSREAYAGFLQETAASRARRPRCC